MPTPKLLIQPLGILNFFTKIPLISCEMNITNVLNKKINYIRGETFYNKKISHKSRII